MSTDFWDYLELRRELHEFIVAGKGDGDEADMIRNRMDGPWARMSESERAAAREYSTRLNAKLSDAAGTANGAHAAVDRSAKTA